MTDLGVILISGHELTNNLERSLKQDGNHPWAFTQWIRQMAGLRPGTYVAWIDFVDRNGRQVNRFTPSGAELRARRVVLARIASPVKETASPFFDGYPYEFRFEEPVDEPLNPHHTVQETADWLNARVDGLRLQPDQLSTLVAHAKSNKIGMFVDGAPRRADYFHPSGTAPSPTAPSSASEAAMADVVPSGALGQAIRDFSEQVVAAGLRFEGLNEDLPRAFISSLVAKRLALLTGLSGSGKTLLGRALGQWLGAAADAASGYIVVPVRPDWTSPEPLLGYEDALLPPAADGRRSWMVPEALRFILQACANPRRLWLLVLDEMNLAHVERYFADVLSGIESGEPVVPNLTLEEGYWRHVLHGPRFVELPRNLLVVGTVNVDETTYQFSPKVLDRAFTFEFRVTTDELDPTAAPPGMVRPTSPESHAALIAAITDARLHLERPAPEATNIGEQVKALHVQLTAIGFEFGHRTFYESMRFASVLASAGVVNSDRALDWIVMSKVLPRLHGSRRQLEAFMTDFRSTAIGFDSDKPVMPLTARKLARMLDVVRANQFVSFAE